MARFARARAEMQGGDLRTAESLWTELIREGGDLADAYNNRGIVRVRLGRTKDGLADFEAAAESSPAGARAHWNAYQLYLQEFRLEKAARIQPVAWAGIRSLVPFDYRAEEMTHGELVASPLRVGDVWRTLFAAREEWVREARGSAFHDLFFRPVPGGMGPGVSRGRVRLGDAVETSLPEDLDEQRLPFVRRHAPWSSGAAKPPTSATRAARRSARGSAAGRSASVGG